MLSWLLPLLKTPLHKDILFVLDNNLIFLCGPVTTTSRTIVPGRGPVVADADLYDNGDVLNIALLYCVYCFRLFLCSLQGKTKTGATWKYSSRYFWTAIYICSYATFKLGKPLPISANFTEEKNSCLTKPPLHWKADGFVTKANEKLYSYCRKTDSCVARLEQICQDIVRNITRMSHASEVFSFIR